MLSFKQRVNLLGANQYVVIEGDKKVFQSYNTVIAIYDMFTQELLLNGSEWQYSKTTMKYFKDFVNYETKFIYESKKQFEKAIETDVQIKEM